MKIIKYSLIATLLLASNALASIDSDKSLSQDHTYEKQVKDKHIQIINNWEFSGDIRAGWVQYDYQNAPTGIDSSGKIIATDPSLNKGHIDSKGFYVMPKLSITSPKSSKIGFKATIAGATDFGLNDEKYQSRTFVYDSNERKSFVILKEIYLKYEDKNHKALVGREELTTPMIDGDDWYMLANSFELAYYANKSIENITIAGGYFSKMSGVWDSGANGTEFHSMSAASFIDGDDKIAIGDKGIYTGAFIYNDEANHNLQVWDYYGEDMYNTLFAQYDYTNKMGSVSYDLGLQYMNFKEVGYLATAAASTNIDYSLYSARFDGKFENGFDFATGYAKYTDGEGQGATLGAFGGYPYFANGLVFHYFEAGSLQNAASYKVQLGYDLKKIGLANTWIGYRYTYFDLDPQYSMVNNDPTKGQEAMKLNGFRISYAEDEGAYFTGTYEHHVSDYEPDVFALRLIGGYKF